MIHSYCMQFKLVYKQRLHVEWGSRLHSVFKIYGGVLACALLSNETTTQSCPSHRLFLNHIGSSDQPRHHCCQFLLRCFLSQPRSELERLWSCDTLGVYGLPAAQPSASSNVVLSRQKVCCMWVCPLSCMQQVGQGPVHSYHCVMV